MVAITQAEDEELPGQSPGAVAFGTDYRITPTPDPALLCNSKLRHINYAPHGTKAIIQAQSRPLTTKLMQYD